MLILSGPSAVKASLGSREPIAEERHWFVYQNPDGKAVIVDSGSRMSQIELKANKFNERYTVKKIRIPYRNSGEYHSQDIGHFFKVSIEMSVATHDPLSLIHHDVRNLNSAIDNDVTYWLEEMARRYSTEDIHKFSLDMRKADFIPKLKDELKTKGLLVEELNVSVDLSESEMEHIKQIRQIRRDSELARLRESEESERLEKEKERLEKEKERLVRLKEEKGIEALVFEGEGEFKHGVERLFEIENNKQAQKDAKEREEYERRREEQARLDAIEERNQALIARLLESSMPKNNGDVDDLIKVINAVSKQVPARSLELENPRPDRSLEWGSKKNQEIVDISTEDENPGDTESLNSSRSI